MEMQQQMTPVQERIQQDVKLLIGELNLQNIMLRSELVEAQNRLRQYEDQRDAKVNGSRPPAQHETTMPPSRDA